MHNVRYSYCKYSSYSTDLKGHYDVIFHSVGVNLLIVFSGRTSGRECQCYNWHRQRIIKVQVPMAFPIYFKNPMALYKQTFIETHEELI